MAVRIQDQPSGLKLCGMPICYSGEADGRVVEEGSRGEYCWRWKEPDDPSTVLGDKFTVSWIKDGQTRSLTFTYATGGQLADFEVDPSGGPTVIYRMFGFIASIVECFDLEFVPIGDYIKFITKEEIATGFNISDTSDPALWELVEAQEGMAPELRTNYGVKACVVEKTADGENTIGCQRICLSANDTWEFDARTLMCSVMDKAEAPWSSGDIVPIENKVKQFCARFTEVYGSPPSEFAFEQSLEIPVIWGGMRQEDHADVADLPTMIAENGGWASWSGSKLYGTFEQIMYMPFINMGFCQQTDTIEIRYRAYYDDGTSLNGITTQFTMGENSCAHIPIGARDLGMQPENGEACLTHWEVSIYKIGFLDPIIDLITVCVKEDKELRSLHYCNSFGLWEQVTLCGDASLEAETEGRTSVITSKDVSRSRRSGVSIRRSWVLSTGCLDRYQHESLLDAWLHETVYLQLSGGNFYPLVVEDATMLLDDNTNGLHVHQFRLREAASDCYNSKLIDPWSASLLTT